MGIVPTSSNISITGGILSGMNGQISANWTGSSMQVSIRPGDANGDGEVNVLDMTKVTREILLLDLAGPGADANLDGKIDVLDLTKITRTILGMDPS